MILTRKQEGQVKYLILSKKSASAAALLGHELKRGSDVAEVNYKMQSIYGAPDRTRI